MNKAMDTTPIEHAAITLIAQTACGLLLGDWIIGAAFAGCWWLGREHAQAEYRWITQIGKGKRSNMPWWGGFDPAVWDSGSVLDWVAPFVAAVVLYAIVRTIGV